MFKKNLIRSCRNNVHVRPDGAENPSYDRDVKKSVWFQFKRLVFIRKLCIKILFREEKLSAWDQEETDVIQKKFINCSFFIQNVPGLSAYF